MPRSASTTGSVKKGGKPARKATRIEKGTKVAGFAVMGTGKATSAGSAAGGETGSAVSEKRVAGAETGSGSVTRCSGWGCWT